MVKKLKRQKLYLTWITEGEKQKVVFKEKMTGNFPKPIKATKPED